MLTRLATETDVSRLTPHGWKRHHEAQAKQREQELLARVAAQPA